MFLASSPVAVEVASSLLAIFLPRIVDQRAPRMPIAATATTTRDSPIQRATSELVATRARFRTIQAYPASSTRSVFSQVAAVLREPGRETAAYGGASRRPNLRTYRDHREISHCGDRHVPGSAAAANPSRAYRRRLPAAVERLGAGPVEPQVHRERTRGGRRQPVGFQHLARRFAANVQVERFVGVELERVAVTDREAADRVGGEQLPLGRTSSATRRRRPAASGPGRSASGSAWRCRTGWPSASATAVG